VGTALIYLLVVVAVAAAVFGLAAAVFGRGEELAPLAPGPTPSRLPVGDVAGDDVRELRFPQAVRGYRMAEVDWVLDRLADELDRVGAERDRLRERAADLEDRAIGENDDRRLSPQHLGEAPVERAEGER
jgi:DivIVA domain-containing protein